MASSSNSTANSTSDQELSSRYLVELIRDCNTTYALEQLQQKANLAEFLAVEENAEKLKQILIKNDWDLDKTMEVIKSLKAQ